MNNKLFIPVAIIIVGVLIAGVVVFTNSKSNGGEISLEEASEKVMSFINETVLQGQAEASLVEIVEENGLYKVKFSVEEEEVDWRITKDGQLIFPQTINLADFNKESEESDTSTTIGNFFVSNDEVIMEDGKPAIYFFGSETCPHCKWEHPIMEEVAKKFEGQISFHNNMDSDADGDVFSKYSKDGYIPTTIIGGKYYRVGSGENLGEEENVKNLTALICKLTNNQPAEVCSQVQDLINSI
ncbi:thioredoxin family protein [Patescibacteria group bacterium]|nr:thioredoxin family protein [Patescibacteria group bacterium]